MTKTIDLKLEESRELLMSALDPNSAAYKVMSLIGDIRRKGLHGKSEQVATKFHELSAALGDEMVIFGSGIDAPVADVLSDAKRAREAYLYYKLIMPYLRH